MKPHRRSSIILELPPLSAALTKFLDAVAITDSHSNDYIQKTQNQIAELRTLLVQCTELADKECQIINKYLHKKVPIPEYLVPRLIFARKKYRELFIKYHRYKNDLYAKTSINVSQLIVFLETATKIGAPLMFKIKEFKNSVNIRNDPKLIEFERKIKALEFYIKRKNEYTIPLVTSEQLYEEIKEAKTKYDPVLDYVPPNRFDDAFMAYAIRNKLVIKFQQLIQQMPSFGSSFSNLNKVEKKRKKTVRTIPSVRIEPNTLENEFNDLDIDIMSYEANDNNVILNDTTMQEKYDFRDFDMFVQFFAISLGQNEKIDKKTFSVIRCSAIRVLFDLYYAENDNVMLGKPCSKEFIRKCQIAQQLTPSELNISSEVFGDIYKNVPMWKISSGIQPFLEASDHIFIAQFYVNPLDISAKMYQAMKSLERAAKGFAFTTQKQKGRDFNMNSVDLSFDDLFSMLIPAFTLRPFVCPSRMKIFLSLFSDLKISQILDYAKVSTCAMIDHVEEIEIPPESIETDKDEKIQMEKNNNSKDINEINNKEYSIEFYGNDECIEKNSNNEEENIESKDDNVNNTKEIKLNNEEENIESKDDNVNNAKVVNLGNEEEITDEKKIISNDEEVKVYNNEETINKETKTNNKNDDENYLNNEEEVDNDEDIFIKE